MPEQQGWHPVTCSNLKPSRPLQKVGLRGFHLLVLHVELDIFVVMRPSLSAKDAAKMARNVVTPSLGEEVSTEPLWLLGGNDWRSSHHRPVLKMKQTCLWQNSKNRYLRNQPHQFPYCRIFSLKIPMDLYSQPVIKALAIQALPALMGSLPRILTRIHS